MGHCGNNFIEFIWDNIKLVILKKSGNYNNINWL
jgi:hypothetical protein